MKTLLEAKAFRLAEQYRCPLCGSHRRLSYWAPEHFPSADAALDVNVTGRHSLQWTPNPDDKAAVAFECGAEISIDNLDKIVSRVPCTLAMTNETALMETDALDALELHQSVPACRECGCTDDRACVTEAGPCHWVEPDLCSACAHERAAA